MPVELTQVPTDPAPLERYRDVVEAELWEATVRALDDLAAVARGRVVWNVNSTARGGGVAELLGALIPYERGAGIDARRVAIEGSAGFFAFTKRLHTLLHGAGADEPEVSDGDRAEYEDVLAENARALLQLVGPRDVVILHDPQTAGLAPALARHGCHPIWRCHIGVDQPDDTVRRAWDFLRPYLGAAEALVFSRRAYVWEGLDPKRTATIAPSIDAFSPKNQELTDEVVPAILRAGGLLDRGRNPPAATFPREDGSTGKVGRVADVVEEAPPAPDKSLVVQVSRWDPLKDPLGVMDGFARYVAPHAEGHLLLAGPAVKRVADDPEQPRVMRRLEARWRRLPRRVRARVHLARLPMEDEEENAALVNALQRHSRVAVQKSLAEGFGLTVAEAMWKARPVVATRVGGIEDQIEHGRSGLLIDDPADLEAFGRAVVGLLRDPAAAQGLGVAARSRVRRHFLAPRQLAEQATLVRRIIAQPMT